MPEKIRVFVDNAKVFTHDTSQDGNIAQNTDLLRAYLFHCLRIYFQGQNVKSVFLPVLSYVGKTQRSPMIHCVIVCEMEDKQTATVSDSQTMAEFLELRVIEAVNSGIQPATGGCVSPSLEADPVAFLKNIGIG
jgi:hypothetical protein